MALTAARGWGELAVGLVGVVLVLMPLPGRGLGFALALGGVLLARARPQLAIEEPV